MSFFNKQYHQPGTAPGTLVESAIEPRAALRTHLMDYTTARFTITEDATIDHCASFFEEDSVTWVHVQGSPSEAILKELGKAFSLHDLALEDILNTGQRPKVETFDDQLFVILSLPRMEQNLVTMHQVSLYVGENFLVSFYDGEFSEFDPILRRLRTDGSKLRKNGVDYLLYSLVDFVIDHGFPVLEAFGLQLESQEEQILSNVSRQSLASIHVLKRELILLRRMLWPQREVINKILRDESSLIKDGTMLYFRDCYDHVVQVMDLIETYRDMSTSLLDIHLSSASNHMNEVMRVLTMIATLFIPLTFIVGVYGMNFDRSASNWNMPELGAAYGYPLVWAAMIAITVCMLLYFRRKGWI